MLGIECRLQCIPTIGSSLERLSLQVLVPENQSCDASESSLEMRLALADDPKVAEACGDCWSNRFRTKYQHWVYLKSFYWE